jgi:hypothetical protein
VVELPDERTARWMTIHIHFTLLAREITLTLLGFQTWTVGALDYYYSYCYYYY